MTCMAFVSFCELSTRPLHLITLDLIKSTFEFTQCNTTMPISCHDQGTEELEREGRARDEREGDEYVLIFPCASSQH